MAPRWHTYWRNGGDVGFPTKVVWELPPGVSAGEIAWPVPGKYTANSLTSYEYAKEAVLLVQLKIAANAPIGSHEVTAKTSWLECETGGSCVPAKGTAKARLVIGGETKPSPPGTQFPDWQKLLPAQNPTLVATARWESPAGTNDSRAVLIEWNSSTPKPDFFPYGGEGFEVAGPTEIVSNTGGKIVLRKQVKKSEGDWPRQLLGLLVERADEPHPTGYEVNLLLSDGNAVGAPAVPGQQPTPPSPAPLAASGEVSSFAHALLLAFLGGLILNIMPCVLPVIALKIFGFVNQAKESPARVRMLGMVYCLGVLTSFVALAAIVVSLKSAGKDASWGMQFQNPVFLVTMTTLVTLVALNLFGVFEISLGSGAMTAASGLARKEGLPGAFFNGVLATALATPCTAPLLAPALGFAFAQPPLQILLLFLAIGAGLALPYLLLTFQPAWLKFLPRPGNWMVHFKQAMGFPMLGTGVWLLSLAAAVPDFGKKAVWWLGLALVLMCSAVWVWGEFVQRGTTRRSLGGLIALLLVVAAGVSLSQAKERKEWEPWSPEAVAKARAAGHPVLVDFTADWCVTCQVNKRTSIDVESTKQELIARNFVTLKADNTLESPAIVSELKKFGRAGVPMVLIYPSNPKAEPILLPTLLTPSIVAETLDKAAK
jgi:thiol:disulfide interchange protein DsbD